MDEKSGGFDSCSSMLAKLMSINPRIFSLKNVHNNTHYAYYLVGGTVPWLWESSKVSVSNFKFSLNHLTVWFAKLCSLRKPQFPQQFPAPGGHLHSLAVAPCFIFKASGITSLNLSVLLPSSYCLLCLGPFCLFLLLGTLWWYLAYSNNSL